MLLRRSRWSPLGDQPTHGLSTPHMFDCSTTAKCQLPASSGSVRLRLRLSERTNKVMQVTTEHKTQPTGLRGELLSPPPHRPDDFGFQRRTPQPRRHRRLFGGLALILAGLLVGFGLASTRTDEASAVAAGPATASASPATSATPTGDPAELPPPRLPLHRP